MIFFGAAAVRNDIYGSNPYRHPVSLEIRGTIDDSSVVRRSTDACLANQSLVHLSNDSGNWDIFFNFQSLLA